MRTFFTVLKNNYMRTIPRTAALAVITIITLASIMLAVHITNVQQVKGHIALITMDSQIKYPESSKYLDIKVVTEKPPKSALAEQKYDAYVTIDGRGNYHIETLRNADYKNMLLLLLQRPDANLNDIRTERGVGVNIIGFMMMFLLMLTLSNLFAFADDKEQGQLRRIAAAPVSFGWYLAAHCTYCLSMLLPEYILLIILKCIGWDIGFSILEYAGLMIVLAFLGISFSLLLNTLIKKPDNANMLGNAVTVLTSVLAGSFYSFSKNNAVLDNIIKLLPQKELMNFAQYLQNGNAGQHMGSILYVIGFSLVLLIFSCKILHSMYVKSV